MAPILTIFGPNESQRCQLTLEFFWAVEKITGIEVVCKDFRVRSATLGRDAIGEVNLEVEHKGRTYRGVGVSTDSVESTILAMLNAINRIISEKSLPRADSAGS